MTTKNGHQTAEQRRHRTITLLVQAVQLLLMDGVERGALPHTIAEELFSAALASDNLMLPEQREGWNEYLDAALDQLKDTEPTTVEYVLDLIKESERWQEESE